MKTIRKSLLAAGIAAAFSLALADAHAQAAAAPPASKSTVKQSAFASPEAAGSALAEAVRAKDPQKLLAIVGPGSGDWLFSGDPVTDANDWKKFLAAYDEMLAAEQQNRIPGALLDVVHPQPVLQCVPRRVRPAGQAVEAFVRRPVGVHRPTLRRLLPLCARCSEFAREP